MRVRGAAPAPDSLALCNHVQVLVCVPCVFCACGSVCGLVCMCVLYISFHVSFYTIHGATLAGRVPNRVGLNPYINSPGLLPAV